MMTPLTRLQVPVSAKARMIARTTVPFVALVLSVLSPPNPARAADTPTCEAELQACQAEPKGQTLQTGQTQCWSTSGSTLISCTGTAQDGALRRGLAPNFIDNGDGTITDPRTGLTWEKLSDDVSIHDWDNTYTWSNATNVKMANLNNTRFAGYADWRLPTIDELFSLADYGRVNPATPVIFHTGCVAGCAVLTCSCTRSSYYWSSTAYQSNSSYAWVVYFLDGYTNVFDKGSNLYVRAVRGGS